MAIRWRISIENWMDRNQFSVENLVNERKSKEKRCRYLSWNCIFDREKNFSFNDEQTKRVSFVGDRLFSFLIFFFVCSKRETKMFNSMLFICLISFFFFNLWETSFDIRFKDLKSEKFFSHLSSFNWWKRVWGFLKSRFKRLVRFLHKIFNKSFIVTIKIKIKWRKIRFRRNQTPMIWNDLQISILHLVNQRQINDSIFDIDKKSIR